MSTTTSQVFVKPHNQAFKKGDIIKTYGGYFRVLSFADNNPYVKVAFIGDEKNQYYPYPGIGHSDYYRVPNSTPNSFTYKDPSTGQTKTYTNTGPTRYNKNCTPVTTGGSADDSMVYWYNNIPSGLKYHIVSSALPPQEVYLDSQIIATGVSPSVIINKNTDNVWYITKVGNNDLYPVDANNNRKVRSLSIKDIVDYFNGGEITSKQLAYDLLGAKNYYNNTKNAIVGG